jgi:hypothetical protein
MTTYTLPLHLDIVPAANLAAVRKNLLDQVATTNKGHNECGIIGMKFLFEQLAAMGMHFFLFLFPLPPLQADFLVCVSPWPVSRVSSAMYRCRRMQSLSCFFAPSIRKRWHLCPNRLSD